MKRIFVAILAITLLIPMLCFAAGTRQDRVTTEVYAVNTVYEEIVTSGETHYQVVKEIPLKNQLGWAGTGSNTGASPMQVLDLSKMVIDGYFTFQFKSISTATGAAIAGTTIGLVWRGSNEDKPSSWVQATANTVFSNVDVNTGITDVAYDINDITGVTPFKYVRFEWIVSGASPTAAVGVGNDSGITPVGKLFIR
ncbi:hypothetical protein LCGC14_3041330 [marine sediment metagenome]|uniref:Uncharacterized protein n=1 Tax=marine sediment metagenome TaxID=412755 RepID=A0A0F8XCQ8_9ZZZZ